MDETKLALPVLVHIHGDGYSLSSGTPYDGAVLSSYTDLIVVTLNFRLGVLGIIFTYYNYCTLFDYDTGV